MDVYYNTEIMAEPTNEKGKLTIKAGGKLSLGRSVESGQVQQQIHGKSKTVTVEVRRTRNFSQKQQDDATQPDDSGLTPKEREARRAALEQAAKAEEQRKIDLANAPKPKPEDVKNAKADASAASAEGTDAAKEKSSRLTLSDSVRQRHLDDMEETRKRGAHKAVKGERGEEEVYRRQGKLTITQALDDRERQRSMASMKRQREKARRAEMKDQPTEFQARDIIVPEAIEVQELANRMAVRSVDVVKELMKLGMIVKPQELIDADTAELVINEFGHSIKRVTEADVEKVLDLEPEVDEALLTPRPPVVTIMGHVDHGKTSLLDAIRTTDVAGKEAGGITQHIGAYQVTLDTGQKVTFVDTPGHEAFTAMRARGAQVTDIVVLVVAADDGIMPQTIEAISHAKAANVPIIVAVNKIDKPGANPQRIKEQLLSHELVSEEFGGEVQVVEVSAKQRLNLDKLLESILVQAEVLELKAYHEGRASGVVIESKIEKGRGVVATVLIQRGKLQVGQIMLAGIGAGKVRAILDDKGKPLTEALPSQPVEILGMADVPKAGDRFHVLASEKEGRNIIQYRNKKVVDLQATEHAKRSVDDFFKRSSDGGEFKELGVIIKGDVQGSVEAIMGTLDKLGTDDIAVKVVYAAVGGITESDVTLAQTTKALILGFNVRANAQAKEAANREKIELRYYSIIYNVVDDMKALMSGMLDPIRHEKYLGNAEVLEVFKVSKVGKVAGCRVKEGVVKRGAKVRLIRDNVVIHEGMLKTLKRFKDEVGEVKEGTECGMAFERYEDLKPGDIIEAFEIIEEKRVIA